MGYVESNLIAGERITYRARLHWILLVQPALVSIALAATALALVWFAIAGKHSDSVTKGVATFGTIMLVFSGLPIGFAMLARRSAEFAVTNKRVILKTGLLRNRTAEMFLNKIESVGVDQSLAGRLLGYGSIEIRGTGGSLEPFHQVSAPLEFRRQIQEQIGVEVSK